MQEQFPTDLALNAHLLALLGVEQSTFGLGSKVTIHTFPDVSQGSEGYVLEGVERSQEGSARDLVLFWLLRNLPQGRAEMKKLYQKHRYWLKKLLYDLVEVKTWGRAKAKIMTLLERERNIKALKRLQAAAEQPAADTEAMDAGARDEPPPPEPPQATAHLRSPMRRRSMEQQQQQHAQEEGSAEGEGSGFIAARTRRRLSLVEGPAVAEGGAEQAEPSGEADMRPSLALAAVEAGKRAAEEAAAGAGDGQQQQQQEEEEWHAPTMDREAGGGHAQDPPAAIAAAGVGNGGQQAQGTTTGGKKGRRGKRPAEGRAEAEQARAGPVTRSRASS